MWFLFYLTVKRKRIFNSQQWNASCELLQKTSTWHQTRNKSSSVHHAQSMIKALRMKCTCLKENNSVQLSFHYDCCRRRKRKPRKHALFERGMFTSSSLNPPEITAERALASLSLFPFLTTSLTKLLKN